MQTFRRALRACKKNPEHYPGVFIALLATVLGAAGALSQRFSIGDGLSAAFAVLAFTSIFILLPFWLLALLVKYIYTRAGIDYDQGRLWLWVIPCLLAAILAVYFGVVGEQVQIDAAAHHGDDTTSVIIFFFYIYLSVVGLVVALGSSLLRLWLLKLKQGEAKT